MEQAFHHLEPRAKVLKQIAKLLRAGGRVVFSEANALNPLLQLQLLRVRGFKMFYTVETDRGKMIYGNERVLSRGSLKRLLRGVGIEHVSSRYYRLFPARAHVRAAVWAGAPYTVEFMAGTDVYPLQSSWPKGGLAALGGELRQAPGCYSPRNVFDESSPEVGSRAALASLPGPYWPALIFARARIKVGAGAPN